MHSASAVCTPSRYALLTGEYPFRKEGGGVWGPLSHRSGLIIDTEKLTLGRLFKDRGYATACIGKWHLGFGTEPCDWNGLLRPGPLELGFDYYFGVPKVNSGPPYVLVENDRVYGWSPHDPLQEGGSPTFSPKYPEKRDNFFSGGTLAHSLYRDEQMGTTLTRKAVTWIREHRQVPFFLYFSTTNIHHPFTPHPRFQGTSDCGRYGDFVHELDWMVGQILETLAKLELANDTLVIFTSDNGGMFNDGGKDAWEAGHRMNSDLLGFKFGAWEGGHRVPFIARWPGHIPAGSRSDQLMCNVDMLGTFAAMLGYQLQDGEGADSFNLLPALVSEPETHIRNHVVLAPRQEENLTLRKENWVYISAQGDGGFNNDRGGPMALHIAGQTNSDVEDGSIRPDAPPAQLYDLSSDLSQAKNLYRENPEVVTEMQRLLEELTRGNSTRKESVQ
jgi:arylsulfatase A-like enzyme